MTDSYRSQAYPIDDQPSPRRTTLGWIAIIVFAFLAAVGILGAVAVLSVYASLTENLKDPSELTEYTLPEETVLLDRTGEVELARFGEFKRDVVAFEDIPPILLDATTAIEDKTFWENAGFDPVAIISAALDSLRGNSRGASTITQQLVRARLLDQDLLQDRDRTYERKLKEIVQSIRVTQHFGAQGVEGKQAIITAYLNQIYYGNQSYGVKAAARSYFGKELDELTPGEAAALAALPKSPSNYDLVRNANERCDVEPEDDAPCPAADSHLIVPPDTVILQRRDQVLELMAQERTPMSKDQYSDVELTADIGKELELARQTTPRWKAPHFVWAVRDELTLKLCGEDTPSCDQLDNGGLRVTTTVDLDLQKIAEKWVKVATIVPHSGNQERAAKRIGFDDYEPWMRNLEDKNVRNGALVAVDYQTGELVAYVGSAEYYASKPRPEFQPQYDVIGQGFRQPGSAFKPFNYVVGIDDGTLTAGDMFMDVGTDFGGGYTPNDADNLERGPVRLRSALQFSLNIPSVKAMAVNTPDHVFARAKDFGMTFQSETTDAGLALALGVAETRPIDLVSAYGTLGNGGRRIPPTTILAVKDRAGNDVADPYTPPEGTQVVSPQAAWIVTDILNGNTNRRVNPFWGEFAIAGPGGDRRPATLKTGTNNDAKDLNAYGYIAPPTEEGRGAGAYALAVGAWNGNSDNTPVSTADAPVFSIDVSTYVWQGFLQEASAEWEITGFERPDGLNQVAIDPFTGLLPAAGSEGVEEWFIGDSAPDARVEGDTCGERVLAVAGHEDKFDNWLDADRDWIARAERGPGTRGGPENTRTAYFYNNSFNPYGRTWGVIVGGDGCGSPSPSPSCFITPTPDPSGVVPSFPVPSPTGDEAVAQPCPTASPTESPSVEPSATPEPTPEPTPVPTPEPTPVPTPEPTPSHAPAVGRIVARPRCVCGTRRRRVPTALTTPSPAGLDPVIELRDVTVRRAGRTILGPLDWAVRDGERWVVLGPNGSGKTTLLSVASMNLWPTTGTVEMLGERYGRTDARELRRRVGFAGSAVEAAMRPDLTPATLIMTARHGAFEPWWHVYDDADRVRARQLGERMGLADHLDQAFGTLSAGERRRTSIARALMPDPDVLILDEPMASLDLGARELLLADLESLAREPRLRAIILVSHHLEEIPPGFGHALVLREGRVLAAGPSASVVGDESLSEAFGMPLRVEGHDGRWTARMQRDR